MLAVRLMSPKVVRMTSIGVVERESPEEDEKDRSIVSRVVIDPDLTLALSGIEEWSHIYVIFYLHQMAQPRADRDRPFRWIKHSFDGIYATRSPHRPNSIGLTLVELLRREENVLWVRGLDAQDGTPVLDLKPYPDWDRGQWITVKEFRSPAWLREINKNP